MKIDIPDLKYHPQDVVCIKDFFADDEDLAVMRARIIRGSVAALWNTDDGVVSVSKTYHLVLKDGDTTCVAEDDILELVRSGIPIKQESE